MGKGFSRRDFLSAGASLAAVGLGTRAVLGQAQQSAELKPGASWSEIREQFGLDASFVHMAGLLLASHPRVVQQEIDRHRAGLNKNPVDYYHAMEHEGEETARAAAATYINAKPANIALTGSTSQALAVVYNGIKVAPHQEILSTTHDHAATFATLGLRSQRMGTKLRSIKLYDAGVDRSADEMAAILAKEIKPETRVVAMTWVHSSTGMRLPIEVFSEVIKRANSGRSADDRILFSVDGVHGFGVEDIDIKKLGCDFFSAGCHKWIFGPRGTGILYGNPEVSRFVIPTMVTFSGFGSWGQALTPGGFHSFEHRWALPAAFNMHQQMGKTRVRARIHDLARQTKEGLAKMSKVKLYTPMSDELSAALVCFDILGMRQEEVVNRLAQKKIIASTTPYNVSYARLTPGLLNTPEEVDRTLAAIRELAK